MFLEVNRLSKKYGDFYAIKDINFSLEKGKFLCLLGPSGSGKSTILHSIGGFIKTDGEILLNGEFITHKSPDERDVATVFQSFGLFPHMSVIKNVEYGLKFKQKELTKKERTKTAMDMIYAVGLKGYEDRYPSELSGGQKQRVALARSLVVKPKLLLMDEPLSSLDAKLRQEMQIEIRKIQKEFNITTIFVTHDQKEAFVMGDEIIILNEGEIVAKGTPQELYDHPTNDFTLNFLGQKNVSGKFYLRPENIKESADGEEFTIMDITFFGETIELTIENAKHTLYMLALNNGKKYEIGDNIKVVYKWEVIDEDFARDNTIAR